VSRLRTVLVTHIPLEVGDGRVEAIEPGLFEAVEPGALECQLLAAQTSQEPRSVALRFGQGKLALALVVTLEDGKQISRLDLLPRGDAHLFDAHARPGPDDDRPRFWLQMRQRTDVRAGDRARRRTWRRGLRPRTGHRPHHREHQADRLPPAHYQHHGCRLPMQGPGLPGCAALQNSIHDFCDVIVSETSRAKTMTDRGLRDGILLR
jgi:hypothetical protein